MPLYPQGKVQLIGEDGNAFSILARCKRAAAKAKLTPEEWAKFYEEATSGGYDHLLQTCMKWFECT